MKIGHCQTNEIAPDMLQGMLLKYITAKLEGCQECACVFECVKERERKTAKEEGRGKEEGKEKEGGKKERGGDREKKEKGKGERGREWLTRSTCFSLTR